MAIKYKLIIFIIVLTCFCCYGLLIAGAYFLYRNSCPCLKEGSAGRLKVSEVAKKNKVQSCSQGFASFDFVINCQFLWQANCVAPEKPIPLPWKVFLVQTCTFPPLQKLQFSSMFFFKNVCFCHPPPPWNFH